LKQKLANNQRQNLKAPPKELESGAFYLAESNRYYFVLAQGKGERKWN
jgi:hypothetical protein